jgi:hypothetical protein
MELGMEVCRMVSCLMVHLIPPCHEDANAIPPHATSQCKLFVAETQ